MLAIMVVSAGLVIPYERFKPPGKTDHRFTGSLKHHVCASFHKLLRITYLKTVSLHLVGRATPDAAGKARPTVNHLTVMNYVKLNNNGSLKE